MRTHLLYILRTARMGIVSCKSRWSLEWSIFFDNCELFWHRAQRRTLCVVDGARMDEKLSAPGSSVLLDGNSRR